MTEKISALLIYDRPNHMAALEAILESQSIEVQSARSCGEALLVLWSEDPPHLVFTDTQLSDGTWAEMISVARKCRLPVNVVVVSRLVDVNLYVQTMERGAFDFIAAPFEAAEIAHIVRSATGNVLDRRSRHENRRDNNPALGIPADRLAPSEL
jgi:DNA-binding NtrC family response regulator